MREKEIIKFKKKKITKGNEKKIKSTVDLNHNHSEGRWPKRIKAVVRVGANNVD